MSYRTQVTPWTKGPLANGLWINPDDQARIDRFNSRISNDDPRRVNYLTSGGHPMIPGQWSGNPWTAPILLLLLNPAVSVELDNGINDPDVRRRLENNAKGTWDEDYPNPWLSPEGRKAGPWCASVPFGALHRHLVSKGIKPEDAWKRIARKCALLELAPWASPKWSPGAIVSTSSLSVKLAEDAMYNPERVVLLGRGEDTWKSVGLLDADLLPKSRGVRSNQSRITECNFSNEWCRIISILER